MAGRKTGVAIRVRRDVYDDLQKYATSAGCSIAEAADQVLRSKMPSSGATLAEPLPDVVQPDKLKNEDGNFISPDGNYFFLQQLGMWVKRGATLKDVRIKC